MKMENKMEISPQELLWAQTIKSAAHEDPDLDATCLSDFEFLQHALIAKDNTKKRLNRIKRLQKFKTEYGIMLVGSFEQGMRDLTKYRDTHPDAVLSIGFLPNHRAVMFGDNSEFLAKNFQTQEAMNISLRGLFYLLQTCQPNAATIRAGFSLVIDGQNMGMHNFSMEMEKRVSLLLDQAYPMRMNQIVFANSSWWMRLLKKIAQTFMSKKLRQRYILPDDIQTYLKDSPYSDVDMLPAKWGGKIDYQAFRQIIERNLQERYYHTKNFKL